MRMTKHSQRETVHTHCRLATSGPRVCPTPPHPTSRSPHCWHHLVAYARMRCCIKRTRLVRRIDASALNLPLPFGEEAVDALQSVLQFPETRTREFRGRGRRNTRRSGIIQCVSAGRLTRHHLARYAEQTCNVLLEHVVRVIGLPLVHDPGHVLSRPPGQCWLLLGLLGLEAIWF